MAKQVVWAINDDQKTLKSLSLETTAGRGTVRAVGWVTRAGRRVVPNAELQRAKVRATRQVGQPRVRELVAVLQVLEVLDV
jgi:hypothetical protein